MKKCITILAVALFVVSVGPGFAQQPQTSTTDRPALEDKRFPTTDPAQTADRPGAVSPDMQKKSDGYYPKADTNRPGSTYPGKPDKSTKSQTQTPDRDKSMNKSMDKSMDKSMGGSQTDGQYNSPVSDRK